MGINNEETVNTKEIFEGRIVKLRVDDVKLPNGKISTREIVEHPGGVAVIAINDNRKIVMVKQFRKPVNEALLEIPAGKLEYDESPELCAKRELLEETGYQAINIKHLITFYTTPGFSNEKMHLYFAKDLLKSNSNTDEDEFLEVYEYTPEELIRMVLTNEIKDSKTIVAILYYMQMRNNL